MLTFREKYGPWALITGASTGIGAEFARQLAAKGLNLVLVARRQPLLETLADALTHQAKIQVITIAVDLSRPDFLSAIEAQTNSLEIGLVVNNAGAGIVGRFLENDLAQEIGILDLNCRAPLLLTHTFGQKMRTRDRGGFIFVASTSAYQGVPYTSHYAATKSYNLLLAEGLWYELKEIGIDVLALSPGLTDTEAVAKAGIDRKTANPMPVDVVVMTALARLGQGPSVIPGWQNQLRFLLGKHVFSRVKNITIFGKMMARFAIVTP